MTTDHVHAITGAFGYSGQYIARRLLAAGHPVRSLTGHPGRPDPFDGRVEETPLRWDSPAALRDAFVGVRVLYNTWWVRFAHGGTDHALAVERSRALLGAAVEAGVERIVHVSITNPDAASPLPYFRGKALVEDFLRASAPSWAILRPAVFFGGRDVLLNNIAWVLRRLPVFGVAGDGSYGVQPIHVDDLAALAVREGASRENDVIDAVGPETFSYEELVRVIARGIGRRARVVHVPRWFVLLAARLLGVVVRDVVLTRDELSGLMADLLVSPDPPTGTTRLTDWLKEHGDDLGRAWACELARHFR